MKREKEKERRVTASVAEAGYADGITGPLVSASDTTQHRVRRIAETAGIDQAPIHSFYGTEEKLFLNALEIPVRMPEALAEAAAGDRVGLGSRIVLAHLQVREDASAVPPC
ncbi:hypothetical protein OHB02_14715 [Streptomyces albidoflavus]|uniref:hypothetical protein n=1 Tax=Streptomyces TaxID=1883 RepID=UPI000A90EB7C|nr:MULTISPECIES: hypothetical protein [unclassified Streptomyces]WSB21402.1 hypothetical protein OHB02_14715 [Streptomyces albidoflavus]